MTAKKKAPGGKVERAMHKMKAGTLKSGSGKVVKSREQAIAIGLAEARRARAKVPRNNHAGKALPPGKQSGRL